MQRTFEEIQRFFYIIMRWCFTLMQISIFNKDLEKSYKYNNYKSGYTLLRYLSNCGTVKSIIPWLVS